MIMGQGMGEMGDGEGENGDWVKSLLLSLGAERSNPGFMRFITLHILPHSIYCEPEIASSRLRRPSQ